MAETLAELSAAVAKLTEKVKSLEDQLEIMQLVAQYGPAVDSGSAAAASELWAADGRFDAVPQRRMHGRAEIAGMVSEPGHLHMLDSGCGHVLTVPHVEVDGDRATGRSYALNIRWDADAQRFWIARLSANTWRWRRTSEGWRIEERVNAGLDGTPGHRQMLKPSR